MQAESGAATLLLLLLLLRVAALLPSLPPDAVWVAEGLTTAPPPLPGSHGPRCCEPMRTKKSASNYTGTPTQPSALEGCVRFVTQNAPD